MIHTVLSVLKSRLNEYFTIKTGQDGDIVKFIDSGNNDPISFTNNAVTPFLINISEDRIFREANQFAGVARNGIRTQLYPEVRIELLVLFISKFSDYNQALKFISFVIKYFQANRMFDQANTPELAGEGIEKLVLELVSLPLEEQNQVWHSLNTSYLPSVLYKIRVLTYLDEENIEFVGEPITAVDIKVNEKSMK